MWSLEADATYILLSLSILACETGFLSESRVHQQSRLTSSGDPVAPLF